MQKNSVINKHKQKKSDSGTKRSESRMTTDEFYRVEISKTGLDYAYQFKIWNISKHGMCILVKDDSELLNHLKVGDILDLKYFKDTPAKQEKLLKTEIKHITKDDQGLFKGHYLIGLSMTQSSD